MKMRRVADWVSIATAPFTVISVVGALTGWLPDTVATHADSYAQRIAVTVVLTVANWTFLFSLLIHYFRSQRQFDSDLGILFSIVSGLLGFALFAALELLILSTLVFPVPPHGLVLWFGIPAFGWFVFGFFALLIVQSE